MPPTGNRKYWFPAKRHGWGWSVPSAWQGRAVLVAYLVLVVGGIPFIQASKGSLVYLLYLSTLTAAMVAICWLTGEPPRRHRGERDA